MLSRRQVLILILLSAAFWVLATLQIRCAPAAFSNATRGAIGFVTAFPIGFGCVLLVRRAARLSAEQLVSGVAVACVVAMLIDGVALRWAPRLYGSDDVVLRLGSAWLLWGYGVSLGIAILMARRGQRA